jgi:outer membrane protein
MSKMKWVGIGLLSLLCLPQMVNAADMKVGVIDFRLLVSQSKDVKAAKKTLEAQFKPKQEAIVALQNSIKADMEKFQRDAAVMTDVQKKSLQEKVLKARDELNARGREYEQALNQAQNKTMQAFFAKVKKIVDEVAASDKYDLILQRENTPFAKSSMDITAKVAKKL